jgi:hypothetical protein
VTLIGHAVASALAAGAPSEWVTVNVGAGACPVAKAAESDALSACDQFRAAPDPEAVPGLAEAEIAPAGVVALP